MTLIFKILVVGGMSLFALTMSIATTAVAVLIAVYLQSKFALPSETAKWVGILSSYCTIGLTSVVLGSRLRVAGLSNDLGFVYMRRSPIAFLMPVLVLIYLSIIFWFEYTSVAAILLVSNGGLLGALCHLAAMCVVGPIVEECVYRGWLWSSLTRQMPQSGVIVLTSAVFMGTHLPTNGIDTLGLLIPTIYLTFVRVACGSTRATIMTHSAVNVFVLWVEYLP